MDLAYEVVRWTPSFGLFFVGPWTFWAISSRKLLLGGLEMVTISFPSKNVTPAGSCLCGQRLGKNKKQKNSDWEDFSLCDVTFQLALKTTQDHIREREREINYIKKRRIGGILCSSFKNELSLRLCIFCTSEFAVVNVKIGWSFASHIVCLWRRLGEGWPLHAQGYCGHCWLWAGPCSNTPQGKTCKGEGLHLRVVIKLMFVSAKAHCLY